MVPQCGRASRASSPFLYGAIYKSPRNSRGMTREGDAHKFYTVLLSWLQVIEIHVLKKHVTTEW